MKERGFWDEYMDAYETCIGATSTEWAPWYVIPADRKWVSRAMVAHVVTQAINQLDLKFPEVTKEKKGQIAAARKALAD